MTPLLIMRQRGKRGERAVWVSKKKWQALEKRVADLEGQVHGQLDVKVDTKTFQEMLRNLERLDLSVELPSTCQS